MSQIPLEPAEAAPSSSTLWDGENGALREASRRALVVLLRGPYLSASRHATLWSALLNDEEAIRSRLADLFLTLVLDLDTQVAFVRNAESSDVDVPKVVRTLPLTFMDTALLLHLRHELVQSGGAGRVIVGKDDVYEQLQTYRKAANLDESGYAKRINASWSKFEGHGILASTSTEGRFEISPVLRLVFGAEEIAALRAEYRRLSGTDSPSETQDTTDALEEDA